MFNFCNNKNINKGINYFILQSKENKDKFLKYYNTTCTNGSIILKRLNLTQEDFTIDDWNDIIELL